MSFEPVMRNVYWMWWEDGGPCFILQRAQEPSLTHRSLFRIMHIFPFLPKARQSYIGGSLDLLPYETTGYNPSPAIARNEIKTFFPSSLMCCHHRWVSGNNYQTVLVLSSLSYSAGNTVVVCDVCICSGLSLLHKEEFHAWNFNELLVANTGDIINRRRHCPHRWPGVRHLQLHLCLLV